MTISIVPVLGAYERSLRPTYQSDSDYYKVYYWYEVPDGYRQKSLAEQEKTLQATAPQRQYEKFVTKYYEQDTSYVQSSNATTTSYFNIKRYERYPAIWCHLYDLNERME
jgi:hypothetical protein